MAILTTTQNGLDFIGGTAFIQTGGTTLMAIETGGFIGIGVNDPEAKLHVKVGTSGGGPYDSSVAFHGEGASRVIAQLSSTADAYFMFGDAAVNNQAWLGYQHSTNTLELHTGATITLDGGIRFTNSQYAAVGTLVTDASGNITVATSGPGSGDITGAGTAGYVTKFTGNKTIGNGPIYFNSNDIELIQPGVFNNSLAILYNGTASGGTGTTAVQYIKIFDKDGNGGQQYLHFELLSFNNSEYSAEVKITVPSYSGFSSSYGTMDSGQGVQIEIIYGGLTAQTSSIVSIIECADLASTSTNTDLYLKIQPAAANTQIKVKDYGDCTERVLTNQTWSTTAPSNQTREFTFNVGATNINQVLSVHRDQKVGIGVTGPIYKLVVAKDGGTIASFQDTTNSNGVQLTGYSGHIDIKGYADTADAWVDLGIRSSAGTQLYLKTDGNVGIGTNSPNSKLEVNENSTGTTYLKVFNQNAGVSATARMAAVAESAQLDIVATSAGYTGVSGWSDSGIISTDSGASGGLILNSQAGGLKFQTSTSEKMRILSGGNVGIGTTNPLNLLTIKDRNANASITDTIPTWWGQVIERAYTTSSTAAIAVIGGTVASGSSGRIYLGNSDDVDNTYIDGGGNQMNFSVLGERMRIDGSGRVGIGTAAAIATNTKLHVKQGASNSYSTLRLEGSNRGGILEMYNAAYPVSSIQTDQSGNTYFATSGAFGSIALSTKMSILTGGNVGIGTSGPGEKLTVISSTANTWATSIENTAANGTSFGLEIVAGSNNGDKALAVRNKSSIDLMVVRGDGNVGIGRNDPGYPLDVNGIIRSKPLTQTSNVSGKLILASDKNSVTEIGGIIGTVSFTSDDSDQGADFEVGKIEVVNTNQYGLYSDMTFTTRNQSTVSEKMRIDYNGNVGIGDAAPSYKLSVKKGDSGDYAYFGASSDGGQRGLVLSSADNGIYLGAIHDFAATSASGMLTFSTGTTEKMRIDSLGKVGIGTTTNTTIPLHVNQTGSGTVIKAQGIGATIEIQSGTAGNATLYQRPNLTGDKEAEFRCTLGSTYGWSWKDDNATASSRIKYMKLDQNPGTLTVKGDVVAYGSPSDKRLKENIKPIESALDKVMKLQGVTFDWKQKEDVILDIKEDIGFIAQDVQKVVPELIRENSNGLLSMRHQGMAPILLEAIKELKAEIDLLKSKSCNCK